MEAIVFSKKNCPPCEKLKQIIPEFQEEFPSVVWTIIDYDENPNIVKQFNIKNTPTTVIIKNKSMVNIIVGLDYAKINSALKFLTRFTIGEDF